MVGLQLFEAPCNVDLLELVEAGQHTSTSNTTENVGTSALEERHDTLVLHDLQTAVNGRFVLDGLAGGHHHATTDRVQGVRGNAGGNGHNPAQGKGGHERVAQRANQDQRLQRVVEAEVAAAVHDNADARHDEATVQTNNAVLREEEKEKEKE